MGSPCDRTTAGMDTSASPLPETQPAQEYSLKKEQKKLDHILIAVDNSLNSEYAFNWAKNNLVDPKRHVVYLLTVASVNPQASMIYSAGLGNETEHFKFYSLSLGGGIPWTMLEDMNNEAIADAKKIVLHYHQQLREKFHVDIKYYSWNYITTFSEGT